MDKYLVVALGGAMGTVARFWVGTTVSRALPSHFPFGTLLINVTGSFIIGFFLTLVSERVSINPNLRLAVAVGFVGGYTTFSTFQYESFKLMEGASGIAGFMNVVLSLMLGFLAVWGGAAAARSIDKPSVLKRSSSVERFIDPPGGFTGEPTHINEPDVEQSKSGFDTKMKRGRRWKLLMERS